MRHFFGCGCLFTCKVALSRRFVRSSSGCPQGCPSSRGAFVAPPSEPTSWLSLLALLFNANPDTICRFQALSATLPCPLVIHYPLHGSHLACACLFHNLSTVSVLTLASRWKAGSSPGPSPFPLIIYSVHTLACKLWSSWPIPTIFVTILPSCGRLLPLPVYPPRYPLSCQAQSPPYPLAPFLYPLPH